MTELLGPGQRSDPVRLNVPPAYVLRWTRSPSPQASGTQSQRLTANG